MKTLKNEIVIEGMGLHSGVVSRVALMPYEKAGIYFVSKNGEFPAFSAVVAEYDRLTGFKLPDGSIVRTAEHLLGAVVGMGLDAVAIRLEGEEVPIMDGSAHPFACAINETGLVDTNGEKTDFYLSSPIVIHEEKGDRTIFAAPSPSLKITYVIDYPGTPVGTQMASYEITPDRFLNTISKARTFCLVSELEYLKHAGLIKGGSLQNALVFDESGLLNQEGMRFPLECVTHKVVDLLGDLALVGNIPIAHYGAVRAGHGIHAKMADRLKRIIASKK